MKFAFEALDVWQKAMELSEVIYKLTRTFPESERFGLTSQVRRAAVSVPANIAEGKGRYHKKEFIQFLYNARGSLYETITLLKLALNLQYLSEQEYQSVTPLLDQIMSKLSGLINSLKTPGRKSQGVPLSLEP